MTAITACSLALLMASAGASSAAADDANPALGVHVLFAQNDTFGTNPATTPAVRTQSTGSTLLAVGMGWLRNLADPTDTFHNSWEKVAGPNIYFSPDFYTAVWAAPQAKGGAGHTLTFAKDDYPKGEISMALIEVLRGGVVDMIYKLAPGSNQSPGSLTVDGPATLIAIWGGDSGALDHTAVPDNGFAVIDSYLHFGGNFETGVQVAIAAKEVAEAGTYTVKWTSTPVQNCACYLIAVRNIAQVQGPIASVADTIAPEAASGTTQAVFSVSLSTPSDGPVTLDYATADGTATAGVDYEPASGTLTFDPGVTTQTVAVTVLGDSVREPNETFTLALSNADAATIGRGRATATIRDDATLPRLQFSMPAYLTTEHGKQAVITVRRTGSLSGPVGVRFTAYDGTATSPADYAPAGPLAGVLSFPSGAATRTFAVPIVEDALPEGDETVLLRLSDPTGGALLGAQATAVLTIRDDDAAGTIAFAPAALRVTEAAGQAVLTVRRSGGGDREATVDYATADGSATAGLDYTGQTGTLTFAPGETLKRITVPVAADGTAEGEEFFRVVLVATGGGASLGAASQAIVTITSSDPAVQFAAPFYQASEAASQALVSVKRTGSLAEPLTVHYATSDGSAAAGTDYVPAEGDLTFPRGVAARTFAVTLVRDAAYEPLRTVALTLSSPSSGVLGTSAATLTIRDDDPAGTVQFAASDASVGAGDGVATIKVVRTGSLAAGQTVVFTTSDGSAVAGTDYENATQTLTFDAREATKLVTIPVLDDGAPGGGAAAVRLSLTDPAGGAVVGPRGSATLWVVENR